VNDLPAYANLSGWSTKGRVACPNCADFTHSIWLKHGRKFRYMGHRKWLEPNHPYRFQKDLFDGTVEHGEPPHPPFGLDVLRQLKGVTFKDGKGYKTSTKRRCDVRGLEDVDGMHNCDDEEILKDIDGFIEEDIDGEQVLWKKISILFDLPHWEHNLLRHNLDVMHIEKNICDNLIGTLLNLEGKSKDN